MGLSRIGDKRHVWSAMLSFAPSFTSASGSNDKHHLITVLRETRFQQSDRHPPPPVLCNPPPFVSLGPLDLRTWMKTIGRIYRSRRRLSMRKSRIIGATKQVSHWTGSFPTASILSMFVFFFIPTVFQRDVQDLANNI